MSETTTPVQDWTYQTPAPEQPTKPRHRARGVVLAVVALAIVTGFIALMVHANGSTLTGKATPDNYLTDTTSLEDSITESFNADSDTEYDGATVTDVTCIAQEHRMFLCHMDWSDDDATTADVQVNAAGDDWVSTNHS